MKLSIIIVSWNVKDDLLKCLSSLQENPPSESFEQILVDNMSSDGTLDAVKQRYPEVITIANRQNLGFGAANNQGIKASSGQYILLLNPDTIIHPGALDILVRFLDDNQDVGVCGAKLLYADGSVQASVRRFPSFRAVLYRHTVFRLLRIFRTDYRRWSMKDFDYDRQADVDQVMGSAMIVRRSVIDQVGGMDESFFMYYEEVDLCYRIKQAHWRIVFLPDAIITHLSGRSAKQIRLERRIMMLKSMMVFFRKHRNRFIAEIFAVVFKFAVILRNICHLIFGVILYVLGVAGLVQSKTERAREKIRKCSLLLSKYLWQVIKM
jgi:GT2 family glycosyltransferase